MSQSIEVLCLGVDPAGLGVGTRPELGDLSIEFTAAMDRAATRQAFIKPARWDLVICHGSAYYDLGLDRWLAESGGGMDASLILVRPPASTLSPAEAARRGAADLVHHGDREHLQVVMARELAASAMRKELRSLNEGESRTGGQFHGFSVLSFSAAEEPSPRARTTAEARRRALPPDDNRIKALIEAGGLTLEYQPIVPLHQETTEHGPMFEVLLRLRDDRGNLLIPDNFFPAAGRHQWLGRLDLWVYRRALAVLARIQNASAPPTRLFINLFAETLDSPEITEALVGTIEAANIAHGTLTIEMRGATLARERPALGTLCTALAHGGHGILLDRVGLGDAPLLQAHCAQLSHIKLDPGLLKDLAMGAVTKGDAEQLIRVATDQDIRVIALAVDSAEILPTLYSLGVDYIQGNFVSKPQADLIYPEVFNPDGAAD